MTDQDKLKLIDNMISDAMEWTEWSKDNMDALISCILTVVNYEEIVKEYVVGSEISPYSAAGDPGEHS